MCSTCIVTSRHAQACSQSAAPPDLVEFLGAIKTAVVRPTKTEGFQEVECLGLAQKRLLTESRIAIITQGWDS
jgi:hypothetical protein